MKEQEKCRQILAGLPAAQELGDELAGALRKRGRGAPPAGISSPLGWLLSASRRPGEVLLNADEESEHRQKLAAAPPLDQVPSPHRPLTSTLTEERRRELAAFRARILEGKK